jgi:hypothetical protein
LISTAAVIQAPVAWQGVWLPIAAILWRVDDGFVTATRRL